MASSGECLLLLQRGGTVIEHQFWCKWDLITIPSTVSEEAQPALASFHLELQSDISRSLTNGDLRSAFGSDQRISLPIEDALLSGEADSPGHFKKFLLECSRRAASEPSPVLRVSFIIPAHDGYVNRADFVQRRLEGCNLVDHSISFLQPLQHVKGVGADITAPTVSLYDILRSSICGVLLKPLATLESFLVELENRLSPPSSWFSPNPIRPKRLVWVEGRKDINVSLRAYQSAKALGISLVIVDNPGHWLQDNSGPHAHLREAFIPTSIAVDEGFVDRVVAAVRSYGKPIDGIMTISDARVEGVAKACEILGYSTSPSSAYALAGDKGKTRLMELDTEGEFVAKDVEDLRRQVAHGLPNGLSYPLIVKPCLGWGSECVFKVMNESELLLAAERASFRHANSPQRRSDILVERYISGPEVDANLVLLDGRLVFCEIADDFPSRGDYPGASMNDNFQETANLLPCGIPDNELSATRDAMYHSILRMGFKTGTFHCEARIKNSSVQFGIGEHGLEDLIPSTSDVSAKPSVYLHEINARPTGYLESVAVMLTWGVDYYALQQLFSTGDMDRFSSLCHPFINGPQWHLALLLIPEEREGVMKTPDTVRLLMDTHADLEEAIVDYNTVVKGGDRMNGPKASELSYLAYISVVSRTGRVECLRLADKVRREFKYETEEPV